MKKLLIHNNNTSFNNIELFSIAEQFVFDIDLDKDLDLYIDEKIAAGNLREKLQDVEIVFIKVALSNNYLEYQGIRLAYHIRLTKSLGDKACIPIVFIAEESLQFLGQTYEEPSILFTGGIYLIKESLKEYHKVIKWFSNGNIKSLNSIHTFIKSINIAPPSNYESHHSIANEWAPKRYFSMFEEDNTNEKYLQLSKKVSELEYLKTLHFKYEEAKSSRQNFSQKKQLSTPIIKNIEHRKIGLIDDEFNKGWFEFYDYWLNKSMAEVVAYKNFRKEYKKTELIKELISWIDEKVNDENPIDVFIIDLRLHDDDFIDKNSDDLTGLILIKHIKKLNPGIQIIISTASNKVWNIQKCLALGAGQYVVKESPEYNNDRETTKSSLYNLLKAIQVSIKKSELAGYYRIIAELKKSNTFSLLSKPEEKEFSELVFGTNGLLDQIFNMLAANDENDNYLNQCLIISFQLLENYCNLNTVGDFSNYKQKISSGFIWCKDGKQKDIYSCTSKEDLAIFKINFEPFVFQTDPSKKSPKSIETYDKLTLVMNSKGTETTTLTKIISVLHYREGIDIKDIEEILKLRFYRSNVAAHLTGEIDLKKFKLSNKDIFYLIALFQNILKKS